MTTRRDFLKTAAIAGISLPLVRSSSLFHASNSRRALWEPLLEPAKGETVITVLHTNDTHSQIDPILSNDKTYPDKGGVARRATLVKRIRKENPNTLLIDAGDVLQGTPYFNFYKGEVEYKAMSLIGYDAGTIGNHEFDNGVESLARALQFANFDIVSTNYDVRGSALEKKVKTHVVKEVGGVRVGLFGLGISPIGLITPENFQPLKYLDPVRMSRGVVKLLREQEKCGLVLGMSHLGYYPKPKDPDEIGDTQVASQVDGIDFIASAHTHTFMEKPVLQKTPNGGNTIIFQVGRSGIYVGRVDFTLKDGKVTASVGRLLDLRDESLA
ncbi:MAG TPA: metallophosphoesterase [Pyrinomonadaceae bacterium]|nr:metallophosphoesterase [Pyrinomonadaceae bacterium]